MKKTTMKTKLKTKNATAATSDNLSFPGRADSAANARALLGPAVGAATSLCRSPVRVGFGWPPAPRLAGRVRCDFPMR